MWANERKRYVNGEKRGEKRRGNRRSAIHWCKEKEAWTRKRNEKMKG